MIRPFTYLSAGFERGKRPHLLFSLILLLPFLLSLLIASNASFVWGTLFGYLFVLCCIYTGRWIWKEWLRIHRWFGLFLTVLVILLLYSVIAMTGYVYFFLPGFGMGHALESFINSTIPVLLLLFGGFFASVIRTAIRESVNGLRLAEQNKASELSLLRSQVSPHFLFNTLNNMYSLCFTQPAKMPDLLLKLSDLLRYSVYEASQPLVTLQDELDYIRNYIELESIRASDRLVLTLKINLPEEILPAKNQLPEKLPPENLSPENLLPAELRIAPMILIVFVENAFKHARNTLEEKIQIGIEAGTDGNFIYFNVENSFSGEGSESAGGNRHSGFGIANVVKRLDLIYPGEYLLKQERGQDLFKVALRLKAK